ncbi:MAG: phytanoyl-CoA dioxygenase family protein [Acidobacteriota bacterium]
MTSPIPEKFYGVHHRNEVHSAIDRAAEELGTLGYTVIDSGLSDDELDDLSLRFGAARAEAEESLGGRERLVALDEHNTLRCPLKYDRAFLALAMNPKVRELAERAIGPYVVLSQQNGIINPGSKERYNQGLWHRDLPYQHVQLSRPLALNALFCLDDFTTDNGTTFVLPATHKQENFPSEGFVARHAVQVPAQRGSFLVLDAMIYHSGGVNCTETERRGVNHVLTAPVFKPQISLPGELGEDFPQSEDERRYLGYEVETPSSIESYLRSRESKR